MFLNHYQYGQQLIRLINDFFDITKIEAGRLTLNLETIPVAQLLKEVKTNNASLFVRKPVKFIVVVEKDLTEIRL